jgi:membrane-bound lytic murein transglycosylase A
VLAIFLTRDSGPRRFAIHPVGFDRLSGWNDDRVGAALPAFLRSCARILQRPGDAAIDATAMSADFGRVGDWQVACQAAISLSPENDNAARRFFESIFTPLAVTDYGMSDGLFTGYYEIELKGSRTRHGPYQTPIYRKPSDLGSGVRPTRAQIEDGALAGRGLELLWVDDPIDAFFLQIQGSGRVRLDGGGRLRIGYDGQNGEPYVPVGRLLIERGMIPREKMSMSAIRIWMKEHPEAGAALRRENPSYVFFREIAGDGPIGAEGVALTAERSIAVDRTFIALGVPIWLEADERFATVEGIRRLLVAQDTGGAIKGPVRGDIFWGTGAAAGARAGIMNARGHYYLLLPQAVAARLAPGGGVARH